MVLSLTTTGLALASLAGASVLTGVSSEMDSYRAFFLSENSRIDDIVNNSEKMLDDLGIEKPFESNVSFDFQPNNEDDEKSSAGVGAGAVIGSVASEGIKSYFKYKYLIFALVAGFAYKFLTSDKKVRRKT